VVACDLILEYTLSAAAVAKGCTAYLAALLGLETSALRYTRGVLALDLPAAATVAALSLVLARSTAASSRFNIVVSGARRRPASLRPRRPHRRRRCCSP
jgi:APA family basic amino acid/polyamine antiporter